MAPASGYDIFGSVEHFALKVLEAGKMDKDEGQTVMAWQLNTPISSSR